MSCSQPACFHLFYSVNVSLSTLAKPEFRLEMLVGSCTAWNMEFSLMARCRVTRLSAEETIPSTRFSARLEQENTFLAPCSLTWSRLLLVSKQTHLCLKFKTHFNLFLHKIANFGQIFRTAPTLI